MSDPVDRLAQADAAAAAARGRLKLTLERLQEKLEPRQLARTAAREIADVTGAAAQRATAVARHNPGALAGLVAAAGLFLARHRIGALVKRKATRSDPAR